MILKAFLITLGVGLCAAILNNPNIYRPCKLNDVPCIQKNLRSCSRCLPPKGSAPAVYTVPKLHFDTPAFNASYDDNNLVIRGLDRCYVSEYYINRKSNNRVLAVDCPWLNFESNRVMYQHFPRSEDGIFRFGINGSYPLITLTTILRGNADLCKEYSNAHVHALPVFHISPLDRPTQNHLTRDLAALGTYEAETFAARAQLLSRIIINNKLCNFGCN